jgi:hypothetical protein
MRFQALYYQSEINKAGYVDKIYFQKGSGSGTFNNFRIYLCHSDKTSLTTTFDSNCKDTPVKVMDVPSITLSDIEGWFEFDVDNTFNYNNVDNLIVEIRWNGDNGVGIGLGTWYDTPNRRAYSFSDTAATGSADYIAYNFEAYIC